MEFGMGARSASVCLCVLLGLGSSIAGNGTPETKAAGPVPLEITPEGLQAVIAAHEPYVLIDAESKGAAPPAGTRIRAIYYTRSPSFRAAQAMALRDRNATATADRISQRLTGTPEEWKRLGLPRVSDQLPEGPVKISPRELSQAIADEVGLQVLDVRAPQASDDTERLRSPFPEARRLMPHEIANELPKLSKRRWVVLVDDGSRTANPLADQIFKQGFPLVAILDGGYPAWISATDR